MEFLHKCGHCCTYVKRPNWLLISKYLKTLIDSKFLYKQIEKLDRTWSNWISHQSKNVNIKCCHIYKKDKRLFSLLTHLLRLFHLLLLVPVRLPFLSVLPMKTGWFSVDVFLLVASKRLRITVQMTIKWKGHWWQLWAKSTMKSAFLFQFFF